MSALDLQNGHLLIFGSYKKAAALGNSDWKAWS
jgi:hypothetical protein